MLSKLLKEIESAKKIWGWFFPEDQNVINTDSVASRFVLLFESYGIHRNQIPRFFEHGLTLVDVENDENLLPKLTEEMLSYACEMFAIRREWLDGAETNIYQCYDFYKHPDRFLIFIDKLISENPNGMLEAILLAPNSNTPHAEALLILEETIGHVGEKEIYRQHICYNWNYQYWKSRSYLTSCIAIACKRAIHIYGVFVPNKRINEYREGKTLLGWNGEGIYSIRGDHWYPEDMTYSPDKYLQHVDEGLHGKVMGLKAWIDLYDKGFMDCDLVTSDTRQKFLSELDKLNKQLK